MTNDGYDPWFLEVPEGRAFYPLQALGFGVWGGGYVVDAEAEAEIRRRLRWSRWIVLPGTMVVMQMRSFAGSHQSTILVAGLLAVCSAPSIVLYLYARRLPPSCKRVGFRQSLVHSARTLTFGTMYAQFVLGCVFFSGGAAAVAMSFGDQGLAVFGLVVGGGMLASWALVWRTQARVRRARTDAAAPPATTLTPRTRSGKRTP